MFAANPPHRNRKRHPHQVYPIGLRRAAKILGYNPAHLSRVLRGERISPPTLRAYQALVAREAQEAAE